jgi:hypothetical protein
MRLVKDVVDLYGYMLQLGTVILKTEMQLNKSIRKETLLFFLEAHENCGVSEKYIGYRPTVIITCIDQWWEKYSIVILE